MKNFFNSSNKGKAPTFKNPFQPPKKKFGGGGQSLGGTKPGKVLTIILSNPGALGVKVEKRPNDSTAIIAMVVPGSQAEEAGLKRGDVVCYTESNGQDEISYDDFLKFAASSQRPMVFDVRRIETKHSNPNSNKNQSAESEARKRAVIAAAEKRNREHKAKSKPIPKTIKKKETPAPSTQPASNEPMSLEAKQAIAAAKNQEEVLANQLGYNPYETNKASAGQARTATVAMTHGNIQSNPNNSTSNTATAGNISELPNVATPSSLAQPIDDTVPPVSDAFQDAFTQLVTTNNDTNGVMSSLQIMQKLIVNATTKGQGSEENAKFRRVRLGNAKIQQAITDINGALELMLAVGFQLLEESGETHLVYPFPSTGPLWLPRALETMQQYQESHEK